MGNVLSTIIWVYVLMYHSYSNNANYITEIIKIKHIQFSLKKIVQIPKHPDWSYSTWHIVVNPLCINHHMHRGLCKIGSCLHTCICTTVQQLQHRLHRLGGRALTISTTYKWFAIHFGMVDHFMSMVNHIFIHKYFTEH